MIADALFSLTTWLRLRTYRPYEITPRSVYRWLGQFSREERKALRKATAQLQFVSVKPFMRDLVARNQALLQKLQHAGVPFSKVIYVSVGDAGSSSHVTLNIIRDQGRIQALGCKLTDGRSYDALRALTLQLGEGAIVYVDDFAGTGKQFSGEQSKLSDFIIGNFSQYFLVHTACEEAVERIDGNGVTPWPCDIHRQTARPLHDAGTILSANEKQCLRDLCSRINRSNSLGWENLAASVVMYRNAPDNVPSVFRGTAGQVRFKGLVPRTDDLPPDPRLTVRSARL